MSHSITSLRKLPTPALVNAAEYWLAPERFARRCQSLGDRFLVEMPGWRPWLCITHPDDIKRVFTADTDVLRLGAALAKGSPHPLVLGPTGLTNVDGPEHLRRRRMQLPPFHGQALAGYEEVMQRKTEETLEHWPYGRPTRADAHMQAISLEVIIAVVFGVTDPDRVTRLRATTQALMREGNSRRFFVQTMIVTTRNKGWDGPSGACAARWQPSTRSCSKRSPSGAAIKTSTKTTSSGCSCAPATRHDNSMPDSELCDAMRTLLLGGHETTASTLAWILERVTRHPAELARLKAAALDEDNDYIDAVIKEAMRLRPVFPITARLASEDFVLDDLTIPAGTLIVPHITLLHRRPDLYPDPLAFRPERFLGERAGTYTWIPFGGGPRRCIGAAFSLLEMRTVLAHDAAPRIPGAHHPPDRAGRQAHGRDRARARRTGHPHPESQTGLTSPSRGSSSADRGAARCYTRPCADHASAPFDHRDPARQGGARRAA